MEKAMNFSISIFIILSIIGIVFFCPVTINVTEQEFSYNKLINARFYSYDEFKPFWDIDATSYSSPNYLKIGSETKYSKSASINFGKLLLEESCIAGATFVLFLILSKSSRK